MEQRLVIILIKPAVHPIPAKAAVPAERTLVPTVAAAPEAVAPPARLLPAAVVLQVQAETAAVQAGVLYGVMYIAVTMSDMDALITTSVNPTKGENQTVVVSDVKQMDLLSEALTDAVLIQLATPLVLVVYKP